MTSSHNINVRSMTASYKITYKCRYKMTLSYKMSIKIVNIDSV